jgi:hypothetical protein
MTECQTNGGLHAWRKSQLEPRNNMEGLAVRREGEKRVQLSSRNMACSQPVCKVISWRNRQVLQTPQAGSRNCSTVAESGTGKRKTCDFPRYCNGTAEVSLRDGIVVLSSRVEWTLQSDTITLYRKGGHQSASDAAQYHTAKVTSKYDACYRTPCELHHISRNINFSAF